MGLSKSQRRNRIKRRVRKNITGTAETPRLTIFRSNKEIYAQVVNDNDGKTLASVTSLGNKDASKGSKLEQAATVGKLIAESATKAGVESVVFDRNGYLYHGRVKALADAAREGGLKF